MSYIPTTWVEKVTKVGPTNMNHLEGGVQAAASVADAAIPAPAGPATNTGLVWNGSAWVAQTIKNAQIDAAAAIARSKLDFGSGLVNADIAAAAAIVASKLSGYPSDATKVLLGDGTWHTPAFAVLADSGVLGGTQATIDTNTILGGNIPQTYSHLKVVIRARSSAAVLADSVYMRVNNDSGTNYDWQYLDAKGAVVGAGEGLTDTKGYLGDTVAASSASSRFSTHTFTIPMYVSTLGRFSYSGTSVAANGNATNTSGINTVFNFGGEYDGAAVALTRLTFILTGGSFVAGSRVTVYGML
jgi:hypothetical protein